MESSVLIDNSDTEYLSDKYNQETQDTIISRSKIKKYKYDRKYRWSMTFNNSLWIIIAFILLRRLSIERVDRRLFCNVCRNPILIMDYRIKRKARKTKNNYSYKLRYCVNCDVQIIYYFFESDAFRLSAIIALGKELMSLIRSSKDSNLATINRTVINNIRYFICDKNLNILIQLIDNYVNENTDKLVVCIKTLSKYSINMNVSGFYNEDTRPSSNTLGYKYCAYDCLKSLNLVNNDALSEDDILLWPQRSHTPKDIRFTSLNTSDSGFNFNTYDEFANEHEEI